jgi:hypothetical protein
MLVASRASTEVIDVFREKHEKDKMMEDSNTHGSEES